LWHPPGNGGRHRQFGGDKHLRIAENAIAAIVGPSGIGKSTFLMTLNRLWETIPGARLRGKMEIRFNGRFQDIYDRDYPVTQLRRQVGTVFQTPNPLPMSVYRNVSFPLKLAGFTQKGETADRVEQALRRAYLWDEVKDRLNENALALSGRIVILGVDPQGALQVPTGRLLRGEVGVIGSRYASRGEVFEAVELVRRGQVRPVIWARGRLEDVPRLHALLAGHQVIGRAAITP